ncbi:glycoside hydrolase family 10 protein [Pedobacter sp. BS3]|uniref:glycoside hydrolase family 10 protein n=1 Tax=Pedobacter sp. BS3 TaxID=2567937 RepID=UPI001F5BDD3A|nr:family 10 glycosylhydrolase [Pedobacter sp. BS3]
MLVNGCKKDSPAPENPEPNPPTTGNELVYPKKEMRAVWLTTAWGLDWPQEDYNVASQKQQYIQYLDKFKQLNINAIFFQVKPMGDAFYNSPYEPWSVAITGVRGKDPGYNVLKFLIDEAHARDIEFHAWMNPYRIATRASTGTAYPPLHSSVKPEWVVSHEKIQIYNPAVPEVRQRLADIVKDIITKYDVDGILFDDYFYPDPSTAGQMVSDQTDFQQYGSGYSSIQDFRRANVNKTIEAVHDAILATKPAVVFSISPTPNQNYNYNTLYADVTKWCQEGWLDMVMPQLYQEIGNQSNDFQSNLSWWSQYNYKAALMIAYGYYKFGDPAASSAFQSTAELEKQFNLTRKNKKVVGNALYSAKYIMLNNIGITDKLATIFNTPSVIPFLGRAIAPAPAEASNVRIENGLLKWSTSGNVRSVVYYFSDLKKEGQVYALTKENSISVNTPGYYSVSTLNVDNQESKPSGAIEKK